MPNIWQIASGEAGRKYTELFLRHDVMFCGPGRFGPYEEDRYRQVIDRGPFSGARIGQVRRFATDVRPGDIVLLRSGYRVVALGLVDETGYAYDTTFDDVYGWDLQHTRRVIWQDQLAQELDEIQRERDLFVNGGQKVRRVAGRFNCAAPC